MQLGKVKQWTQWQFPNLLLWYSYFPVTLIKRVLLRSPETRVKDPMVRRFWDIWGFLKKDLVTAARQTPPLWIHMSSGGEALIASALLDRLKVGTNRYLLSTTSYDSYELLGRCHGRERVFFSPWDTWLPVTRVLKQLKPRVLLFVQNAYLPVLLRQARRNGTKTILINGLMSRNVASSNPFMQRAIALGFHRELDWIGVQGEKDYSAFRELGVPAEKLEITGDLYADLIHLRLRPEERSILRRNLRLDESAPVMIAGSTHPGEGKILLEAFRLLRQRRPQVRLILAPRLLHEVSEIMRPFVESGLTVVRRTDLTNGRGKLLKEYDVLVLDTFGELSRLYGIADVAYIGASLVPINDRRAGHNPLEPLVHGTPVLFGPHMNLWRFVTERVLDVWPQAEVHSETALAEQALQCLSGQVPTQALQEAMTPLIQERSGALERTFTFIRDRVKLI